MAPVSSWWRSVVGARARADPMRSRAPEPAVSCAGVAGAYEVGGSARYGRLSALQRHLLFPIDTQKARCQASAICCQDAP